MLGRSLRCSSARRFSTSARRYNGQMNEEIFSEFGKNTASKKESDTFISVFNRIMRNERDAKKHTKSSLQLVFEKNLKSKQNDISISSSNKDLRSVPLSVSSKMVQHTKEEARNLFDEIQRKHELKEALKPSLDYLDSLTTDYDLILLMEQYVEKFSKLVESESFKPNQTLSPELMQKIADASSTAPNAPLINEYTLPLLVSTSFKLLSTKFHSSVEMLSFFQNLKNLEIKAFTFLCTEEIYNEVLERTWQDYKDIRMIDSLVSDMKANGVLGDMDTISIIGLITNDMDKMLNGQGTMEEVQTFWNAEDEALVTSIKGYRRDMMEML